MEGENRVENAVIDMAVALAIILILLALVGTLFGGVFSSISGTYAGFVRWFYDRNWSGIYIIATIVFSLMDVGMIAVLIYAFMRLSEMSRIQPGGDAPLTTVIPKEEVRENWEQIRKLANSDNSSNWQMAIIRADALLDDKLQDLGYQGETMVERLKIVDPYKFKSLERIWGAHRLRNAIAHDPGQAHSHETIVHALRGYEQALSELGFLQTAPIEEQEQTSPTIAPPDGVVIPQSEFLPPTVPSPQPDRVPQPLYEENLPGAPTPSGGEELREELNLPFADEENDKPPFGR